MKFTLIALALMGCFSAHASKLCYRELSDAAFTEYAKSEQISFEEARAKADLFMSSFNRDKTSYTFKVEIADRFSDDSEDSVLNEKAGSKFEITLDSECVVVASKKID